MWRFILLSFLFLGVAFYELSGGADYRHSANSIWVQGSRDMSQQSANDSALSRDAVSRFATEEDVTSISLRNLGLAFNDKSDIAPVAK